MPPQRSQLAILPKFWEEAPDPVHYREQKRWPGKFNRRTYGLCQCPTCWRDNGESPGIIRFEQYCTHFRTQSRITEENEVQALATGRSNVHHPSSMMIDLGDPAPSDDRNESGQQYSPDTMTWLTESTRHVSRNCTPLRSPSRPRSTSPSPDPFDIEVTDSEDEPAPRIATCIVPAHSPNLSLLRPIISAIWTDFVLDFVACTEDIDTSLTIQRPFEPREKQALSMFEQVMYGTNLALVGQWNVSHAAIQFNMAQAWNMFEYGLLLGRQQSMLPTPGNPLPTDRAQLKRFLASNTVPHPVKTLRSAERHLSPNQQDVLVVHAACTNVDCQHVFHQFHKTSDFKVGSTCDKCEMPPDGQDNVGLVPFPRMPLQNAVFRFLQIPGTERLCEETESTRMRQDEFDKKRFPGMKIYRDAYSGSGWPVQSLTGRPVSDSGILMLRLNIGIDWYQPSRGNHARKQSVGPIIAHVTNLPLKLRAAMSLALLLGITPGPREIRGNHLYQYLLPLCLELRHARISGFTVSTPRHPEGRLIYVAVGSLCCDAPARVAITGGPSFNKMEEFCIRCTLVKRDLLRPTKPVWKVRKDFERTGKVYAQRKKCLAIWKTEVDERDLGTSEPLTWTDRLNLLVDIEKKNMKTKGHPSAFDLVPLFDKESASTHDPMHMICIGVIKVFFQHIMFVGDKYHHQVVKAVPVGTKSTSTKQSVGSGVAALLNAKDDEDVDSESSVDDEGEANVESIPVPTATRTATTIPNTSNDRARVVDKSNVTPPSKQGTTNPVKKDPPLKIPMKVKKSAPMLNPSQRELIHVLMQEVILPPEVDGITAATFFTGRSGAASAAQWKTFVLHYAAFVLIELWTRNEVTRTTSPTEYNAALAESELLLLLQVVQISDTALRPTISSQQIQLLRIYVQNLQDTVYNERPTIVRCCNVHWLSHLADDIERYGPVYSWWLFGFERANKVLKGANNNGHSQDTPLIAYNKYLRLGSLGQWGACSVSDSDLPEQHLAEQSYMAFKRAIKTVNTTEEQKDAASWQTDTAEEASTAQLLDGVWITVQAKMVAPISTEEQKVIALAWNSDSSTTQKIRMNGSKGRNKDSILSEHALFLTAFRIGRRHFRTPGHAQPIRDLQGDAVLRLRGAFFEWRTDGEVFGCRSRRAPVGVIESVFEVNAVAPGKVKDTKRFIKLYMLAPFEGHDPYRFKELIPYANIWLWRLHIAQTQVLPFSDHRIDCMRPVIIKPLLTQAGNDDSGHLLAIKGITHV